MRLNEILVETDRLDEKPMGFLSKMKDKALAKVGSDKAAGRLELGKEANLMKKEFMKFLGTQDKGEGATPDMVLNWLAKNGYPTDGAKEAMKKITTGAKVGGAIGKVVGGTVKGAAKAVGKLAQAGDKLSQANDDMAQKAADANAPKPAATTTPAPTTAQDTQKTAPNNDPNAQKTAPQGATTTAPTTTEPDPKDAVNVKSMGKKKIVPPSGNKVAVNQSIDFSNVGTLLEGLSGGQLDNVFYAAVQDAIARDQGGQAKTSDTSFTGQAASGGIGGALKGMYTGALGDKASPKDIKAQLDSLTPKQKIELGKML
jgi:hypothetical protein